MDCPECAKNGKTVAMKKDKGQRPGRRPERAEPMFIEDDMWVCPTCEHAEVAKDSRGGQTRGTSRCGIGAAAKSRRHGPAIQRATRADRVRRAESVAIPVLAYICRYNFELSTNASRPFHVRATRDRRQTRGRA